MQRTSMASSLRISPGIQAFAEIEGGTAPEHLLEDANRLHGCCGSL